MDQSPASVAQADEPRASGPAQQELADRFRAALAVEGRHLASVRAWVTSAVEGQAGVETAESAPTETRPIG
jgi:hypothetical protein